MSTHNHTDNDLIDSIAQGEISAFEALYDRYASNVLKRCYFFCLNAEDARDLMQEVWMKVFLNLKNFKKEAAFSTWLYRLTTNHCLNYMKSKAQSDNVTKDMETGEEDHQDPTLSVEIKRLLSRLPREDRMILAMKYMGEYTYEEISTICGIGVSAAKMKVSRLIAKLREEVGT